MTIERAIRLAAKWAAGHVCTLREGEAQEYHELCHEVLKRTQWISVKERLPKHGDVVLCKTLYSYRVFQWDEKSEYWLDSDRFCEKSHITHWMPLPKPPENMEG